MFLSNGLMMPYQISNMVNCGVYLFTVQDLYTRYYFTYFNIGTRSQFTKTMQKSIKEYWRSLKTTIKSAHSLNCKSFDFIMVSASTNLRINSRSTTALRKSKLKTLYIHCSLRRKRRAEHASLYLTNPNTFGNKSRKLSKCFTYKRYTSTIIKEWTKIYWHSRKTWKKIRLLA